MPIFVVEDDRLLRLVQLVLDPRASAERTAAFADFCTHDVPDFLSWRDGLRRRLGPIYPADVRLVTSERELQEHLPDAEALVVEDFALGKEALECAPRLELVQQFGMITDSIDEQACRARAVPVITLRRRTNIAVAEHALMLMLALAKRLPVTHGAVTAERLRERGLPWRAFDTRHTSAANFGRIPGLRLLAGSTLGLLGFGEIGREVASLGKALGMCVLYHKRRRLDAHKEREAAVEYRSFDDLFEQSDIVCPLVPSIPETRNLVDEAALRRMRRGAFLINVSRAPVVARAALLDAIASGHLGGAAFDALYEEPAAPDDPLLRYENVILTPHIAGASRMNILLDIEEMLVGMSRLLHP